MEGTELRWGASRRRFDSVICLMFMILLANCLGLGCMLSFSASAEENDGGPLHGSPGTSGDSDTSKHGGFDSETTSDEPLASDDIVCPTEIFFSSPPSFTDIAGKGEGTKYLDVCPDGQVIVGFRGAITQFDTYSVVGEIRVVCGIVLIDIINDECVIEIEPGTTLPLRGGAGDVPFERNCPPNQVVVGFHAKYGADVDQFTFSCAPLRIAYEKSGNQLLWGDGILLDPVGGVGGGHVVETQCPSRSLAIGAEIVEGKLLRSLSLMCQLPSLVSGGAR